MCFVVLLWGEIRLRCRNYSLPMTLFFMEAYRNYFLNYVKLLEAFCSISGLRVSMRKSILLGINTDEELLQNMAAISGCDLGVCPIKYLDLPLGDNPRNINFWEPVVSKITKKLDGWKKVSLEVIG